MITVTEHEYTTYPRRFAAYKWYKPVLVGLLFFVFYAVVNMGLIDLLTKAIFGATVSASGYEEMDVFTTAGAFNNGLSAASFIPCFLLAALIVKDRPVSSYWSSMGGWRWKVFLKTLVAAFVIVGIPTVVMHLIHGRTGDMKFTVGGFILLTLLIPFQGIGEELTYRSYIVQTVSSWFRLPVAGIIAQVVFFTVVHPYGIVGRIEIAVSAILYALVVVFSNGLESASAMHIANNMSELYMIGIGFGNWSSDVNVSDTVVNIVCKIVFFLFILYAGRKLHWFDEAKCDDVEKFNARIKK